MFSASCRTVSTRRCTLWRYTYNAAHQRLTATDAAGQTTAYTYNDDGQIETITTPPRAGITENRLTTYTYVDGQLQSVTSPAAGATTSFGYDDHGRVRTVTDLDNYTLTYDYDALDRVTRVTYPDATYEETVYDRLDAVEHIDREGRREYTSHDALRRVVSMRGGAGRTTTQRWCVCGSLDAVSDANGNSTSWERDLQGRVTRETRADGSDWEYTYENRTSRLKIVKDAKGQETHFSYFRDDHLQQRSYPIAQIATASVGYTYDPVHGRLMTMSDGTGTTQYSYHEVTEPPSLGATRLAAVDGPRTDDTITYGYDELGRQVARTLNGVVTTWQYDALGRLTSLGDPIGTFANTYLGASNRRSSLTYPNAQVTTYLFHANAADRQLQEIHHRAGPGGATLARMTFDYDNVGNITVWSQQYGSAASKAYDLRYDAADHLTSVVYRTTDPSPTVLTRYGYAYDPVGNRTSEQVDDAPMSATYDNRNRLTSRQAGGTLLFKGTVTELASVTVAGKPATVAAGTEFEARIPVVAGSNQTEVRAEDPSGNVSTKTYQVTVSGTPENFGYDANGSLTNAGTRSYEWDAANRLVRVLDGGAEVARFVYDGLGRRVEKVSGGSTRTYVYDGTQLLEERIAGAAAARYVDGPGIDEHLARVEGGAVHYYFADHLEGIVLTTDSSGVVTLTRRYDPWGNSLEGAAVGGYAYSGREWDSETQLYYHRARYYDPRLGRFLSVDPVADFYGFHHYAYAESNPVSASDPSGLAPIKLITLCIRGYRVVRNVGFREAVKAVRRGENVLAPSTRVAKRISRAASNGKGVIRDVPHGDGYMPHFHPVPRTGGHVFYQLAAGLTLRNYTCDDCALATLAEIGDFFNPLAIPKDVWDIYLEW